MKEDIFVTRPSMPPLEEYVEEIKEIWESHWLTNMGSKYKQFQAELEKMLDVPHIVFYCNGHLALENIIEAMDFPKGGEVITTPFTFASTTHAIVRCGLKPVFCDINDSDYTIDAKKIEALITNKTVAIIPVHVYGNMCDVEAIKAVADKHDLKVIYDAAHAFSVKYKGRSSACFGDASMFSFHATKVFNTIEGGAVSFHDDELVQKLNELKNFGIHGSEEVPYIGGNARINEFCAAMGICNLRHVDEEISKRKTVVERYRSHLKNVAGIKLSPVQADVEPNYAYFPVLFDEAVFGSNRDEVFTKLAENGIYARKYFYPLTNTFDCYKGMFTTDNTHIALEISMKVLTLPLYADLSMDDVDRICEIILLCKK
ncbi:MAG: DegT/DnrJ/EryC1/StrS family aminotransferase [Oscillospiraceae bacterium]|nr:DegT/DnrJ/EryC1/StrS family aminotransferase [Oscillospiraceae bacterium]